MRPSGRHLGNIIASMLLLILKRCAALTAARVGEPSGDDGFAMDFIPDNDPGSAPDFRHRPGTGPSNATADDTVGSADVAIEKTGNADTAETAMVQERARVRAAITEANLVHYTSGDIDRSNTCACLYLITRERLAVRMASAKVLLRALHEPLLNAPYECCRTRI